MATKTARIARADLPLPKPRNDEQGWSGELDAVQALWDAYMALNATGGSAMAIDYDANSPMRLTARAGAAALSMLPGVGLADGRRIWAEMCDNGSGAQWNYDLWRKGEI